MLFYVLTPAASSSRRSPSLPRVSSLARQAVIRCPILARKTSGWRCFGPATRQPLRRRLRRRGLPLGAFRSHRLGGIGDRRVFWGEHSPPPSAVAPRLVPVLGALALVPPRVVR